MVRFSYGSEGWLVAGVGNWVGENTFTVGDGAVTLGGPLPGYTSFSSIGITEFWYAIVDGDNRESGICTISGQFLIRGDISATIENGVYNDVNPLPIQLSGEALVFSTFNKRAFDQFLTDVMAVEVGYDNSVSGLSATNVQAAIDEIITAIDYPVDSVFGRVGVVEAENSDYDAVQVDANTAGFDFITATNVQGSLEQLEDLIQYVASGVNLQGLWNATLNDPDLLTIPKVHGDYWYVGVPGATLLPGVGGSDIGDWMTGERALYINDAPNIGFIKIPVSDTIPADNVIFDPVNYNISFPDIEPDPDTAQEAIDFGWPILENANAGNIGKSSPQPLAIVVGDLRRNGFYSINSTATDKPVSGNGVLIVNNYTDTQLTQLYIGTEHSDFYIRTRFNSIWSAWAQLAKGDDLTNYLPLVGGTVTGQIKGITPASADDLTRKDYVDGLVDDYLPLSGGVVTGQVKGIAPVDVSDLTRKDYVDTEIANIGVPVDSVFGRTGAILAESSDYDADQVDYDNALTPAWDAIQVQAALINAYDNISFLAGAIVLKGVWDALANDPDLVAIPKTHGNYWIVSVAGTTPLPNYPDGLTPITNHQEQDRILWLDDVDGSGFASIRPQVGEYLLLTGGTMLGDITLSNGLSVNTVTDNADAGNIGK
ncbi:MAG: hypothetical protein DRI97_06540, partial [Bacteroidetes bacterium]